MTTHSVGAENLSLSGTIVPYPRASGYSPTAKPQKNAKYRAPANGETCYRSTLVLRRQMMSLLCQKQRFKGCEPFRRPVTPWTVGRGGRWPEAR
jgi:hypothetical protein